MATLTSSELTTLRQQGEQTQTFNCTKVQLNAAIQAIEDWFEANRASLMTAMNTASSPVTLTNAQKKKLLAYYLQLKFGKENT